MTRSLLSAVALVALAAGCDQGFCPTGEVFTVPPEQAWTAEAFFDTGLVTLGNGTLEANGIGAIRPDPSLDLLVGPSGNDQNEEWQQGRTFRQDCGYGAVLARYGKDGAIACVGAHNVFSGTPGAPLYLGVNDTQPADNGGHFEVCVLIR